MPLRVRAEDGLLDWWISGLMDGLRRVACCVFRDSGSELTFSATGRQVVDVRRAGRTVAWAERTLRVVWDFGFLMWFKSAECVKIIW